MYPVNARANRKKLNAASYVFAALIFLSFSLLLFSTRSFVINIKDAGLSVFSGVRSGVHALGSFASGTVNAVQELASLREDYRELASRMERYQILERNAADVREENHRLREQLVFTEVAQYKWTAAEIIGRDPDNLFLALLINKGRAHGVEKDMPVIAYQNGMEALVGKVTQTGQFESYVLPLYDERSKVASRFAGNRQEGIAEGQGRIDKPLLVQSIDKRARYNVQAGDLLVTSGMGGIYPPGIVIGRVQKVLPVEGETSLKTEVESAVVFSKLEYVFVIEKDKKAMDVLKNGEGGL
ncbi:MAG: rod shape-determining protein MreC [Spirochaetaceae bacterium]|jgi:rod shape-determining protein MreC|nr:rod shape-determining protein MreC [Spirochaetaceae bacterium]